MKNINKLTINLKNIEDNIKKIRELTNNTPFLLPVKANAYGHGLEDVVKYFANSELIDFYGVANVDEARLVRKHDVETKILLFGTPMDRDFEKVVALQVNPTISSIENHESYNKLINQYGIHLPPVHIKVDTGMGRNGITKNQLMEVIKTCKYKIEGVYTHFATAEDFDMSYFLGQKSDFFNIVSSLKYEDINIKYFHCANSASTIKDDSTYMNLTRVGLASYGYYQTEDLKDLVDLKPAMALSSQIISIKPIEEGTKVSYGAIWEAKRDSVLGIIPLGYGDGLHRCLSNKLTVMVEGKYIPVIGMITMDQIILDITEIKDTVSIGSEVIVLNSDKKCSVETMAEKAQTIPYEIICHINSSRMTKSFIS